MNFDKTKKEIIRAGVHTYIEIRKAAAEEILKIIRFHKGECQKTVDMDIDELSVTRAKTSIAMLEVLGEELKKKFGVE